MSSLEVRKGEFYVAKLPDSHLYRVKVLSMCDCPELVTVLLIDVGRAEVIHPDGRFFALRPEDNHPPRCFPCRLHSTRENAYPLSAQDEQSIVEELREQKEFKVTIVGNSGDICEILAENCKFEFCLNEKFALV